MSQRQEIPHGSQEQQQADSSTQGLDATQVSEAMEESSSSSSDTLMPDNLEEALAAGTPDSPQSPHSACSTSTLFGFISSSKSDESSGSQEEDSSASSESLSETESLPEDPLDEKVTLLVQFLLHKYQKFEPITKADMIDVVIKEYRDDFPEIFRRTFEYMELVFGVDLEEVDTTSHSYALVNKLGLTYDPRLSSDEGVPKTSLLIMVLGVIFMKGNTATEEDIWEVLNTMNLHPGMNHFIFGEPRKFITQDLVQEKYLEYSQVPNSDPPCNEFLWGPRAHAEASKMKLLEFLAKVNGSDPTDFPSQYEEALRDEEERAQARASARAGTTAMDMASSSATAMDVASSSATAMDVASSSATAMDVASSSATAMDVASSSATAMDVASSSATAMDVASSSATAMDVASSSATAMDMASSSATASSSSYP